MKIYKTSKSLGYETDAVVYEERKSEQIYRKLLDKVTILFEISQTKSGTKSPS